jgi:type VI secretion system secreted protein Hcp
VIELEDIIVTNMSTGGAGSEDRLTENVTLNFRKFKHVYTTQEKTGAAGAKVEFGWDVAKNTKA